MQFIIFIHDSADGTEDALSRFADLQVCVSFSGSSKHARAMDRQEPHSSTKRNENPAPGEAYFPAPVHTGINQLESIFVGDCGG